MAPLSVKYVLSYRKLGILAIEKIKREEKIEKQTTLLFKILAVAGSIIT